MSDCPHGKAGLPYCAACLAIGAEVRADTSGAGALAAQMEPDALRVWLLIGERLVKARGEYGDLELATDKRCFTKEALEEMLDHSAYLAMALVRGGDDG